MQPNHKTSLCVLLLLTLLCSLPIFAQKASVTLGKRASRIPKACVGVVPASIEGTVDIPALLKEAYCKGAGDMMAEYSYVLNSAGRSKDKKGKVKEETTTYEVFIPTLKSGTHAKGILVATSRNGVPVPAGELEKARKEAGERLEKAEEKNARETPSPAETNPDVKGMMPVGMYTHSATNHSSFTSKGSAALAIHTFLKTCDLTLARREQHDGRDTLVFNFAPRPDAQFVDNEKYIAQLTGEIWIDARDRIVTRLVGWPQLVPNSASATNPPAAVGERPPAVYVEMMRLPEGIWLPQVVRINGADYQKLFDGINTESLSTFSNYIRFSTEIKDVKVNTPNNP
ncbi:MAG TPA: hypothetical protein VK582_23380 [Pyrinomonadaceae bacterium]|nr:hypothetical protein [Pyrinomonadaceae bacterium]